MTAEPNDEGPSTRPAHEPAFSVVIPLYDKERDVARTIAAVRAQRFGGFEVIVVDDGSRDASLERAREAAGDDARFRFIRQPNGGVSRARNTGIAHARAGWIALLDADDEWLPGYLHAMHALIAAYPDAVLAGCDYDTPGAPLRGTRRLIDECPPGGRVSPYDFFANWARSLSPPVFTSAACIRRDALARIGGFRPDMHWGEDLLAWIALQRLGPFAFVDEVLVHYHAADDGTGVNRTPGLRACRSHEQLLTGLDACVAEGRCPRALRDQFAENHVRALSRVAGAGEVARFVAGRWPQLSARACAAAVRNVARQRR